MAKTVKIAPPPNLIGKSVVNFTKEEYNAMVYNKGLDCIIETAVKCPCKTVDNPAQTVCKNCLGIGWVLINPIKDRVLVDGINSETKFKEWSTERLGITSLSFAKRTYDLGYMDRVTIVDSSAPYSEVLHPFGYDDVWFAYTIYKMESVIEVFQFDGVNDPLKLLQEDVDYIFDDYKLIFIQTPVVDVAGLQALTGYEDGDKALINSLEFYNFDSSSNEVPNGTSIIKPDDIILPAPGRWVLKENFTVSIRYRHQLQYHILDIPHHVRNSYRKNSLGRNELQELPLQAIGRAVHWVVDRPNYNGDNIIDNSYQTI